MKYLKEYANYGAGEHAEFDNDNGESFWGNKGAGVLVFAKDTKKFLINLRSEFVNEPNEWGIWGGKIDENEDIKTAVIRELEEESGYDGAIELVDAYVFKNPNGNFKYYNFIGIIESEFEPILDWESADYEWVTFDELIKKENKHFGLINLLNDDKTFKRLKILEKNPNIILRNYNPY